MTATATASAASKRRLPPCLLSLPALLVCIGMLIPFFTAAVYPLQRYRLNLPAMRGFIWFDNYKDFFFDPPFRNTVRILLLYTVLTVALEPMLGLAIAMLLGKPARGHNFISIMPLTTAPGLAALFRLLDAIQRFDIIDAMTQGGPGDTLLVFQAQAYLQYRATGCTVVGSTGMHMRMVKSANDVAPNTDCTGYTMAFPVPGMYAQMQSNMASTLNIDWLIDLTRGILADAGVRRARAGMIAGLDERVLAANPAKLLFHPYIPEAGERGPFVDASARASFIGLSLRHGFGDLMRAVYEGLALASRDCCGAMGAAPEEVRLTGGAARSKALRKIIGAALNTRLRASAREEAGAAGAAMMAAVSLGQYATMDDCMKDWARPLLREAEAPDAELAARYAAHFARMKKGAAFVNTARGPLVDYDALYDALASGQLRGAMLETFAVEPPPADWPLLHPPNVTLTPHIAGASARTVTFAAEMAAEEVRRHVAGEPPPNPR